MTPDQLTRAYMAQVATVRNRVTGFASTLWARSPSLRDADVQRMTARLIPTVHAGQLRAAALANGYVQRLAELEGVSLKRTGVDRANILGYRGVPAEEVYARPAVTTYSALAKGEPFTKAREAGAQRLLSLVTTDLQQARNRQSHRAYEGTGFDYTIRTLRGAESCALCVIASTQRYKSDALLPMHPGCGCGQRGVRADRDPGQVIDQELLDSTHAEIAERVGDSDLWARDLGLDKRDAQGRPLSDYTDLIITRTHSEYGPTLTWRSQKFTSAADIAALT